MRDFNLPIQNPFYRSKKLPVALLHFTAGFLFINGWYESRIGHYPSWLAAFFLTLAVVEIGFTFFAGRLQVTRPKLGAGLRLIAACSFGLYAFMLLRDSQTLFGCLMILIMLAFIAIYLIELRWNKPFIIGVDDQGIWFPKLFRSQLFPWKSFNHVILRNNLLTLDFSSNRIVQFDLAEDVDEDRTRAFNLFCIEHVETKPG